MIESTAKVISFISTQIDWNKISSETTKVIQGFYDKLIGKETYLLNFQFIAKGTTNNYKEYENYLRIENEKKRIIDSILNPIPSVEQKKLVTLVANFNKTEYYKKMIDNNSGSGITMANLIYIDGYSDQLYSLPGHFYTRLKSELGEFYEFQKPYCQELIRSTEYVKTIKTDSNGIETVETTSAGLTFKIVLGIGGLIVLYNLWKS